MLFHLFIFFSHMNWSIPSYSDGKLTIRMIHVHIVIQCHSYENTQEIVRNSFTCRPCRQTLSPFNLTRHSLANTDILFTFISMINNVVSLFIFFSHMNWPIPSYSGGKLTIRMIHVHIVIQCHSQANTQELVRISVDHMPSMQIDTFLFNLT